MIKMYRKKMLLIPILLIFCFILVRGEVLDPSMVYCKQLGYKTSIGTTDEGEIGLCIFPDGSSCDSWEFLKGKCGINYSYCKKIGYDIKTVSDYDTCIPITAEECAVCVLPNGTKIEVTRLMQLQNTIGACGDDTCGSNENYENCPQDCPLASTTTISSETTSTIPTSQPVSKNVVISIIILLPIVISIIILWKKSLVKK